MLNYSRGVSVAVYLDLLLLVNFAFNFVLLVIAGWMGLCKFSLKRYGLAALAGAIIWLIFFFHSQYIFIDLLCRIGGGLVMVGLAWRPATFKALLTNTALVVIAGQLLGGGIFSLALAVETSPLGRTSSQLPVTVAVAGAAVMLGIAAWWSGKVHTARQMRSFLAEATITFQGRTLTVEALLDSGNTLRHPVSGWPVLILERKEARRLFAEDLLCWLDSPQDLPPEGLEKRIALIPYQSVGGCGLLAAVKLDRLDIKGAPGKSSLTQVYAAVRPKNQSPLSHQALAFPVDNWKEGETG
ncbi:MAG: sigma-E processing peptidase SpoIIGA [Firmicutes bacterium]|nr:sigma-E processing peptidase SpoIIGA [Bacillota bacterium]